MIKRRASGGIRTPDQLITNQSLWPTELHWQFLFFILLLNNFLHVFPSEKDINLPHLRRKGLQKYNEDVKLRPYFLQKNMSKDKSMNNKLISFLDELPYGLILNTQYFGAHKSEVN